MSKWIIFGASGFAGRALTPLLERNKVAHEALSSKALDLVAADAPAKIAKMVQDGDSILMLSAYTPEKGNAGEMTVKNIQMMRHLLAGIEGRKIGHCIYVSTDAVYPLSADIIDEQTPLCPESLYGYAHAVREQFARERFAPDHLTILRPCAIYGEGDSHNAYGIGRFLKSAREHGKIELFGGGEEYRDHIHVDDFAAVMFDAMSRRVAGTFAVASGQSWRFSEIAAAIRSGMNGKISIIEKPRALPILHRHVDISALRTAFPSCRPRAIGEGIGRMLKAAAA